MHVARVSGHVQPSDHSASRAPFVDFVGAANTQTDAQPERLDQASAAVALSAAVAGQGLHYADEVELLGCHQLVRHDAVRTAKTGCETHWTFKTLFLLLMIVLGKHYIRPETAADSRAIVRTLEEPPRHRPTASKVTVKMG